MAGTDPMRIAEELASLAMLEVAQQPELRDAAAWLGSAYQSAYRRGCNYQFSIPANDQDIDILNREIVLAMVAYAKQQQR